MVRLRSVFITMNKFCRKTAPGCVVFRILIFTILIPLATLAQTTDSLSTELPDLEVTISGKSQFDRTSGNETSIRNSDISRLTRNFGEADMINQIRELPATAVNGDYGSGLSVNGTDPTQARYIIDGAPVTFPYRFGGIFSTFNSQHFSSMRFLRQSDIGQTPRIGSLYSFTSSRRWKNGIEGDLNVATTASSISLRAGSHDRLAISASGRISYINQIYSGLLTGDDDKMGMAFHDINASAAYRLSQTDMISASIFRSSDNVNYYSADFDMRTLMQWSNTTASLSYQRDAPLRIKAGIYYSGFSDLLLLNLPQFHIEGPSSIRNTGVSIELGERSHGKHFTEWKAGFISEAGHAIPQWATFRMGEGDSFISSSSVSRPQDMITATLFGSLTFGILQDKAKVTAEMAAGIFSSKSSLYGRYNSAILTPRVAIIIPLRDGSATFTCARLCQPMHQVGFSELGLASNFWIGANRRAPMQNAMAISAVARRRLPWEDIMMELSVYYNYMRNQAEYQGEVMEVIDTDYDPFSRLIIADGYNYGTYISLYRSLGNLTGDISFSYGEGKRHIPGQNNYWNALHSEGISLKSSLQWHTTPHWTFSASFRYSSGRRYTPVEAIYVVGGNIAMQYGRLNSRRLPPYNRLDIGASYSFKTGTTHPLNHLFNFSLLNAYGHKNVEMQYFVLNSSGGKYSIKRIYSIYRFLPSLSYSIEFR